MSSLDRRLRRIERLRAAVLDAQVTSEDIRRAVTEYKRTGQVPENVPARAHEYGEHVARALKEFGYLHQSADEASAYQGAIESWTSRWTPCRLDQRQMAYLHSLAQTNVAAAGRRTWKTEGSKRRVIKSAIEFCAYPDGRFFACAPTQQQAKDIFWDDLKAYTPTWALRNRDRDRDISESELTIRLGNGVIIKVAGLDKPARIEGRNWDGGVVDEYADCRPDVLDEHILPMLARGGWIDIIGVPGGRNHYYRLAMAVQNGTIANAAYFHWTAAECLHLYLGKERADAFLAQMRAQMDARTFDQEFNAGWITMEGRVYYCFEPERNVDPEAQYDPQLPLLLALDFNVKPGVGAVLQEVHTETRDGQRLSWLRVIDEIWIANNSTTIRVCEDFGRRYHQHPGEVRLYGDATGGARGSAKIAGSDWDLVHAVLGPVFKDRLHSYVEWRNPPERVRVNCLNSRLYSADGQVWLKVHPKCVHTIQDFEGVAYAKGTGDIDKKGDENLTHLTDAIGYVCHALYPPGGAVFSRQM